MKKTKNLGGAKIGVAALFLISMFMIMPASACYEVLIESFTAEPTTIHVGEKVYATCLIENPCEREYTGFFYWGCGSCDLFYSDTDGEYCDHYIYTTAGDYEITCILETLDNRTDSESVLIHVLPAESSSTSVPEYPSSFVPFIMIAGFMGCVLLLRYRH